MSKLNKCYARFLNELGKKYKNAEFANAAIVGFGAFLEAAGLADTVQAIVWQGGRYDDADRSRSSMKRLAEGLDIVAEIQRNGSNLQVVVSGPTDLMEQFSERYSGTWQGLQPGYGVWEQPETAFPQFCGESSHDTVLVPDWALPAIVNGDTTGLSEEDERKVRAFVEKYSEYNIVPKDVEPSFCRTNDLDDLGADCVECNLVKVGGKEALGEAVELPDVKEDIVLVSDQQSDDYPDADSAGCDFLYFHGNLEDMFGYDLFSRVSGKIPDGVFKGAVKVIGCDKPCTMYKWPSPLGGQRGLVVLDDDADAVAYAEKKFEEQPMSL